MLPDWMVAIEAWVPLIAGSPWVYLVLFALAAVDGFFPPVPSESVVIALASLSVAHGEPNIVLVAIVGAVGAFTGDQAAYLIGSRVDVRRLRLFRTVRGRPALDWAEHALVHRGSSFILAARYIPVGRVAVNMTAGALGYPRRRFLGLTALAAATWAVYGTVIGAGAGIWLADRTVVAVAVGVVLGTAVGLLIDRVLRRWTRAGAAPTVLGTAAPATVAAAAAAAPASVAVPGAGLVAEPAAGLLPGSSGGRDRGAAR